ncbi:MAG: AgmX/PglI C-terminal domain-containing protein [Myxococcota bacterium]|jgi:TonB family protein|nr:AgmX/PglI C-terminal domain-containing protein [Myxococcota bacterium]
MSELAITFKVVKDGSVLFEKTLAQDVVKIGRMASSHLQIDDDGVSRMHAVIEISGNEVNIIDLGSATGTLVNGKKVNKAPLTNGDVLNLGGIEVHIAFSAAEAAAVASPPASGAPMPVVTSRPPAPPMAAAMPMMGMRGAPISVTPPPAVYVDLSTVEDTSRQATEVVVMWQGVVLDVRHYMATAKKTESFTIGEDPTCDFPIPPEELKGQTKVPLLVSQPGGAATATILPGASGDVTFEDGRRVGLAELVSTGQAHASGECQGGYSMPVPTKSRMKMDFGSWTFLINSVAHPRKFVAPMDFNWTSQIYLGIAAALHIVFMFLIYFIPPDPEGFSLDMFDENNRFIKYALTPPEVQQEEVPEWLKKDKNDDQQGGKGKRHKGEEGQMGKRDAKKTDNHYGIKGPKDNPDPHMARDMAKEMAKSAGVLSYLSAANAPTSPFGRDTALGVDPENALGALMGNQVGENFGYGGLGLRGTGRGGGGTGEGTIGLGNLNTIGHGGGGGSGSGYGRGAGGLGGRRGSAPQIRSGAAMVKGSLSKEVIRRIVQRHINEVKFCYEKELAKRPDLAGRVAIKFIISGTGAVQTSAVAESTIGNPAVENCIAQAVQRWTFPQPEGGGIVIVTYPFLLEAPGG